MMARKNIFELLDKSFDIKNEFQKIQELFVLKLVEYTDFNFKTHKLSLEEYFNNFLLSTWKQRRTFISCYEIRDILFNNLNFKNINDIITALEYYLNIIEIINLKVKYKNSMECNLNQYYYLLLQNINIILEHLNYEKLIISEEEKVLLIPKNPEATAVAEISSEDTALAIFMYNHHSMKGDVTEKRRLLYQISLEYETLLKKPIEGYNDFFNKTNQLLNNLHIRHDNKTKDGNKNNVIEIDDKELENWYDELYQLLLFCVLIHDNLERKNRVADFLKNL